MQSLLTISKTNGNKIEIDARSVVYEKKLNAGILSLLVEIDMTVDEEIEKEILSTEYTEIRSIKLNDVKLMPNEIISGNISIFSLSNKGLVTEEIIENANREFLNILVETAKGD